MNVKLDRKVTESRVECAIHAISTPHINSKNVILMALEWAQVNASAAGLTVCQGRALESSSPKSRLIARGGILIMFPILLVFFKKNAD